jgi:putative hydrolase of the HAD superfamily
MTKAIFLDRDGVICHRHVARSEERNRAVAALVGRPDLHISGEDEIRVFWKAYKDPRTAEAVTPEQEEAFWWRWGELMLAEHGLADGATAARDLCARYPYYSMLEPYPEVPATLGTLRQRGYRLAVISNTFPSLETSIQAMGLHDYFESFTASALVGIEKPEPGIYVDALEAIGVAAAESIFVDDLVENVLAARALGFTAFHLNRRLDAPHWDEFTIHSLTDLLEYLEVGNAQ